MSPNKSDEIVSKVALNLDTSQSLEADPTVGRKDPQILALKESYEQAERDIAVLEESLKQADLEYRKSEKEYYATSLRGKATGTKWHRENILAPYRAKYAELLKQRHVIDDQLSECTREKTLALEAFKQQWEKEGEEHTAKRNEIKAAWREIARSLNARISERQKIWGAIQYLNCKLDKTPEIPETPKHTSYREIDYEYLPPWKD